MRCAQSQASGLQQRTVEALVRRAARRFSAALEGRYAGCMTSIGASGLLRSLASAAALPLDASPELSTATIFLPPCFPCAHGRAVSSDNQQLTWWVRCAQWMKHASTVPQWYLAIGVHLLAGNAC